MLSRVANSIYWMCRYIERAENVARFIDVNLNLLLDLPADEQEQWSPLIKTTGDLALFEEKNQTYTQEEVIWFLTFDRSYHNSILSCVSAARENAKSIREIISSEMWEHLNTFYLELINEDSIKMAIQDPARFFQIIKMRSHLFTGLLDSTMSHGEAWNFARIGMMLERADKTSRILDVKYYMLLPQVGLVNTPMDNLQWISVLRSTSAFEMFRKEFHRVKPANVADFLIFNRFFPRSIYHCVEKAQISLHRITGSPLGAAGNAAEKKLGRLKADLEYTDIEEVIESGLHEFLDDLQTQFNQIGGTVASTFFNIEPKVQTSVSEQ
ncbi:MAG: alpha-E domain-containing protein [Desulforhopalus sp.]